MPQGSILVPLLFVLHVNDLPAVARKCSELMYADDTVLFYSGIKVAATIEESPNENLDLIGSWLYNDKVKTEAMLFGTHARLSDVDFGLTLKGRLGIKRVFYSGVVKYVLSRAGKRLGMLGRSRGNLTPDCANSIYTAYIRALDSGGEGGGGGTAAPCTC